LVSYFKRNWKLRIGNKSTKE